MGLKRLFSSKKAKDKKKPDEIKSNSPICDLFREGVYLKKEVTKRLLSKANQGVELFKNYNNTRIELAFASFDEPMKLALYEIIYLLNTNEKWLSEWKYKIRKYSGKNKVTQGEDICNLYAKDAPCGVKGISELSPVFQKDFEKYIKKEFGKKPDIAANGKHLPIDGIYSIGSIGTIGHKNISSDLDLEVQYDLENFLFDINAWNDKTLKKALLTEHQELVNRYFNKKGINQTTLPPEKTAKADAFFKKGLAGKYPILFDHLIKNRTDLVKTIENDKNNKLRSELIRECINLMKNRAGLDKKTQNLEKLLKKRILLIQEYIQAKFPEVEICLFPFSLHEFRKGQFGSTLESEESSGGAYELILNYETLMPGIFFTPNIPSHFLFPPDINNSDSTFNKLIEYLRFGVVDIYSEFSAKITNQGPTPDLTKPYVARHYSAVYWEAFKASHGNLPKATLNLLRYEMLIKGEIGKTIIQLIKDPSQMDDLAFSPNNIEDILLDKKILSPQGVLQVEKDFPLLLFDPWWLRYKALKIAFGVPGLISDLNKKDMIEISRIIDLAFAFHIRLSDVFTKPGDQRTFDSHREQVLVFYLSTVFPENSDQRNSLFAMFIGDVEAVNVFEASLRDVFQGCIIRIQKKASQYRVDEKTTKEFEVWHHFYMRNFKPKANVIQRTILNHLKTPRGRVQIGFQPKKGWFFKSLQRESLVGKRFEFSILNLLPEEITLIKNTSFLYGLVYCVINGYYGIFASGTLKETMTAVEYDRKQVNVGSDRDNHLAFIRPDQIERLMQQIIRFQDPLKVGYLNCITKKRKIVSVMVFLNLLKYGRLSILYRDNLDVLYVDSYDLPGFSEKANDYLESYKKMFKAMILHKVLGRFFKDKKINPRQTQFYAWVNTNCVETTHSVTNEIAKENDLSENFKDIILSVHGRTAA